LKTCPFFYSNIFYYLIFYFIFPFYIHRKSQVCAKNLWIGTSMNFYLLNFLLYYYSVWSQFKLVSFHIHREWSSNSILISLVPHLLSSKKFNHWVTFWCIIKEF
jgi:hypothetical protein